MAFLRSVLHALWMTVTVIPYALAIMVAAPFLKPDRVYWMAAAWLSLAAGPIGRAILGIKLEVQGFDRLPQGQTQGAVLLVKHQSAFETFLMPAMMPRPLAFVFKKELLKVPFFGWSMARLDMIHIDRDQRARAFVKVVQQGRKLLARGVWVIMFPEGTRIARGERGNYKSGGTRLAIQAGAPVVPIAVTSARVWPRKGFIKYPGTVVVSIGYPIPSEDRKPDELMLEVEEWIEAEMRRLDPEAYR